MHVQEYVAFNKLGIWGSEFKTYSLQSEIYIFFILLTLVQGTDFHAHTTSRCTQMQQVLYCTKIKLKIYETRFRSRLQVTHVHLQAIEPRIQSVHQEGQCPPPVS